MPFQTCISETIGSTPLVRLNRVVGESGATVLAKLEYFNPAGGIKARAALAMIEQAERDGSLGPGGTIVEASSGNTGFALAMLAAERGYSVVIVCTDKTPTDKIGLLQAFGARVVTAPDTSKSRTRPSKSSWPTQPGRSTRHTSRPERSSTQLLTSWKPWDKMHRSSLKRSIRSSSTGL